MNNIRQNNSSSDKRLN